MNTVDRIADTAMSNLAISQIQSISDLGNNYLFSVQERTMVMVSNLCNCVIIFINKNKTNQSISWTHF